jgi:hypothetical protein
MAANAFPVQHKIILGIDYGTTFSGKYFDLCSEKK